MPAWVAEREYIHRKAGKCGCKLAVSVIALPRAVSAPPPCIASLHSEGVKGKCQPNASHLAASGPIPEDSDHLLCQVIVW